MPSLWVTPDEMEGDSSSPYAYEAAKTASFILWSLSGRKYAGTRTVTEHYECPCYASSGLPARLWNQPAGTIAEPYLEDGAVVNRMGGCGCSGTIGGVHTRMRLRHTPVRSIQKVTRDGEVVDPDSYQVVNSSMIQPSPGHSFDPCGADITYTYGVEPPTAGRRAARYLAQEFAKGWAGEECDLPDRVTSISRQGVSMSILDDNTLVDDMRTGIYSVDLFLKAVNPDNARQPARVFSPDLPRATRVTSTNSPVVAPVGPYDLVITPGTGFTWSVDRLAINADILAEDDWGPQAQITSWNGATLLEFSEFRFDLSGGLITVNLTGQETGTINSDGSFDLYAVNQSDGFTVIHLLTSSVRLVTE